MTPDSELLATFARTSSEDTFAELVNRHVNLVYSAALRQVNGDTHLAQDVAQSVFTDLARKAGSLAHRESLTGWLYTSAHFAAAKTVRTESRRRDREEKFMREPTHENTSEAGGVTPCAPDWEKLRPALDDAMHDLRETDREAVLLRYFENQPFAEVGAKLGLSENAARMRVERALEKLRAILAKRGITTATALASVISANAVQLAPANLTATLTTASIATAGTGTTFTLLKIMTATQLKVGVSALAVAGAAAALVVQHQAQTKLREENESLTQQIAQLKTNNDHLSDRLTGVNDSNSLPADQMNELLRLRGEVARLQTDSRELAQLKVANARNGNDPMETAVKALLGKINFLKQRLEQMPDKKIPELQFLDDETWAQVARTAQLQTDDDVRRTLSELRDIAKQVFAPDLGRALQKFAQANGGQLPTDVSQLKPYFNVPLSDDLLQRYQMLKSGNINDLQPNEMIVAEKAAVDDEYDTLFQIGLTSRTDQGVGKNSGNSGSGSWDNSKLPPPNQ